MPDLAWLRAENAKLTDLGVLQSALALLRIEAAHGGPERNLEILLEEIDRRQLKPAYEAIREHVRGEKAAGRGIVREINLERVMSETTALARRENTELQTCGALPMSVLVEQVRIIHEAMRSVMVEGTHYGKIPGCGDKPTLLKPGAEKLGFLFRLALEIDEQVVELGNGHREYRVKCRLKSMQSGEFVGEGVGSCSTMESKYRWRGGARLCPECGKACIKKSKFPPKNDPDAAPGYYCFAKIGGCGANFSADDQSILSQSEERQENPDIADSYNTCLKMAKKRASVDAVLTATAASDIFAQDLEDLNAEAPPEEVRPALKQQKPVSRGGQHSSAPADRPKGPAPMPENGQKLYDQLDKRDQELSGAGKCKRGDLLRHVSTSGISAGMPKNMGDWKPSHIAIGVGMAKEWIADLDKPAPASDTNGSGSPEGVEEPATV